MTDTNDVPATAIEPVFWLLGVKVGGPTWVRALHYEENWSRWQRRAGQRSYRADPLMTDNANEAMRFYSKEDAEETRGALRIRWHALLQAEEHIYIYSARDVPTTAISWMLDTHPANLPRYAGDTYPELVAKARAELIALKDRMKELEADRERLDTLEEIVGDFSFVHMTDPPSIRLDLFVGGGSGHEYVEGRTFRDALDAARRSQPEKQR